MSRYAGMRHALMTFVGRWSRWLGRQRSLLIDSPEGTRLEQSTLRALLAAEAPGLLPAARSLAVLAGVSDALFPVHASGAGYGPLGPDSVLLGDTVGLATETVPDEEYAAPELREGGDPTPASDAYAYAALALRLLGGAAPAFDAENRPQPVGEVVPGFPAFAGEAIARALQPDPTIRPLPKVLFTLLKVVPVDRWPASRPADAPAAPGTASDEPPAVQPAPLLIDHTAAEPVEQPGEQPAAETAAATRAKAPDTVETPIVTDDDIPTVPPAAPSHRGEWRDALGATHEVPTIGWSHADLAEDHAVPDIGWSHADLAEDNAVPDIGWTADADPTRPSGDVPAIDWSAEEAEGDHEPYVIEADDAQPSVRFSGDFALVHDGDVPEIEPLDEAIPASDVEHRPGRRSRRKKRERSPDRTQKLVLVLVLLILIVVGVAYALLHKDSPKYDPRLQGASRTLSHVVAVRE